MRGFTYKWGRAKHGLDAADMTQGRNEGHNLKNVSSGGTTAAAVVKKRETNNEGARGFHRVRPVTQ